MCPDVEAAVTGMPQAAFQTQGIEDRMLAAEQVRELLFILVNESRQSVPYELACLVPSPKFQGLPLSISSIAEADPNAPFSQYLTRISVHADLDSQKTTPRLLRPEALPAELREEWNQWLPAHVLCCAVMIRPNQQAGLFMAARSQPWTNPEAMTMQRLCTMTGALLRFMHKRDLSARIRHAMRPRVSWIMAVALVLAMFLPIRSAILGMGEVVPLDPIVVRAPVDGIVDRMSVRPFENIQTGQELLVFEQLRIDNQIIVAKETLAGAEEALRQAKQGALFLADSPLRLPELEIKREEARSEMMYLQELKLRMRITAPMAGVALIDDFPSWTGKSVAMGERLLTIADPSRVEVKIWVPAGDTGLVHVGDLVHLYMNVSPNDPIQARVYSVAYQPDKDPKGNLAYEVLASIEVGVPEMRIGHFGTGRIFGQQIPLGLYLFRRPLAILRVWIGV